MAISNVPEKLKLNKFQLVRCPRPQEFAQLHGYRLPSEGSYSGDENFCDDARKTEQLQAALEQVRETVEKMPKQE